MFLCGTRSMESRKLYYAKIGIGTPPKEYYVQVDTGSDIMWINCIQCRECPKRGYHGLELTLYDPEDSFTGKLVTCSQDFCAEINGGAVTGCKANASCLYTETYGDGSYNIGYFVMDVVQYDSVSGDLETKLANGKKTNLQYEQIYTKELVDANTADDMPTSMIGQRIVLPASFIRGPRDMRRRFLDAMTLVQDGGKPDIFLTMTCNPKWPEIQNELLPWQKAEDRPDVVSRVFHAKIEDLKEQLLNRAKRQAVEG
ncbi:hypothetical protein LXL04_037140 [Taraxacum kok-saghyz]